MGFALSGCATSVSFTLTNPSPRPLTSRAVGEVRVFEQRPDRSYVEVGRLHAEKSSTFGTDVAELVEALKQEAAARGCEGLLLGEYSEVSRDNILLASYRAACIVFVDGSDEPVSTTNSGARTEVSRTTLARGT